ncbi:kinase-like domain-containing protein [Lineolata rhizophorae]|uniref:Kinase-like domain-containing protein n=1 Tax=Lineolata rhizophorae TaxID=578093 RepID=A0A6A6P5E3_9PEZI|nr:kinase-like domain-containing protein [Lineolata rhizophorae]
MVIQDDPSLPVLSASGLRRIGIGTSGAVFALDEERAVKFAPVSYNDWTTDFHFKDLLIERSVYERLGSHPRICRYIGPVRRGIILERLGDAVRKRLMELRGQGRRVPYEQALKWSRQIAEGIAYVHRKGVIQGDIGCHNALLDGDDIKLCDFAGSSVDGKPPLAGYELRSQRWEENDQGISDALITSEIFALGSTIYEIWTTNRPYHDKPDR